MMKWKLCLIATALLAALLLCFPAGAETSGKCGDNLTWTLDDEGTLTISGTGEMSNFLTITVDGKEITSAPWGAAPIQVVIENGVTCIGNYAFCGCSKLTIITIPDSVTSIKNSSFYNCSNLPSINMPDNITSIGSFSFGHCTNLSSISLPKRLTSIGVWAFVGCSNLPSITIPDSVTNIGASAFWNCTAIKYANLDSDGAKALSKAGYSFSIPDTNYSLQYLFTNDDVLGLEISKANKDINSLVVPDYVTHIGDFAFSGCSSLTDIVLPDNLTYIGESAFNECTNLVNINIPNMVTRIGNYTFFRCSCLSRIIIPNKITSIGECAFWGYTSLTDIVIPNSVKSIGGSAFHNCTNLYSITIWGKETVFGTNALPPLNQRVIYCVAGSQAQAYAEAKGIDYELIEAPVTGLTLPANLATIESEAFAGLNVDVIVVPASVQSIAPDAFSGTDATLSVVPGSYAENWAKEHQMKYQAE